MDKIKINLNPKKPAIYSHGLAKALSYTRLLVFLVVFFALVAGITGLVSLARGRHYNRVKAAWQKQEPKYRELASIKQSILDLERQREGLVDITSPRNMGFALLESIFLALPQNIWLTNLQFREDLVELQGYVLRWEEDPSASLSKFRTSLGKSKKFKEEFTKIDSRGIRTVNFRGREVTQFFLECKK